jgi:Tfp pilus assembly protein PilV
VNYPALLRRDTTSVCALRASVVKPSPRSGLTLLEVLIAIFILLVGLLSVLALIPVAMLRMNQALTTDRATAVAQAAIEEIKVRGMLDRTNWVTRDGGNWVLDSNLTADVAYAIDPEFIARNTGDLVKFDANYCYQFPYGNQAIRMRRVSFDGRMQPADPLIPMTLHAAERIFVSHDDLLINTPDDPSLRPRLVFSTTMGAFDPDAQNPPAPQNRAVRQIQGNYSWLATVSPTGDPNQYNVAVAVFRNRDTTLPTATQARDPNKYGERVVDVAILGAGIGGGEIRLWIPDGVPAASKTPAYIEATPGQWLLLCSRVQPVFRWYRIVAAGAVTQYDPPDPDGAGPIPDPPPAWAREMTLVGPD